MKAGHLFAGIGGLDLGCERAGIESTWQVEIDEACRKLLTARFPNSWRYGDVRNVGRLDLKPVDVVTGGFPCQDLSVAGNRAGLAGERSGLWFEFHRILTELRPPWVVIENVPGLLSSDGGCDMAVILQALADLGYGWAYRVLDAQYFGVAQRRRRVFIVGCLGDAARAAQILFESQSCDWDSPPRRASQQETAGTLGGGTPGGGPKLDTDRVTFVAQTLGTRGRGVEEPDHATYVPEVSLARGAKAGFHLDPTVETFAVDATQPYPSTGVEVTPTLGGDAQAVAHALSLSENQRAEVRLTEVARQLSSGGGKPGQGYAAAFTGMAVRRLTPTECERLQGFPDGWTEGFSDSTRYRMLGNAVCVPVAEWIARRIVKAEV